MVFLKASNLGYVVENIHISHIVLRFREKAIESRSGLGCRASDVTGRHGDNRVSITLVPLLSVYE